MLRMINGIMRDLEAECAQYEARWAEITQAAKSIRPSMIAACCARHELEPDEMMTAEEKARYFYPQECQEEEG